MHPEVLLAAGAPILKAVADELGYSGPSVFGSAARHQARPDSDIELSNRSSVARSTWSNVGLKPGLDGDIRREAVPL